MTRLEFVKQKHPELTEEQITDRCLSFFDLDDFDICFSNGAAGLCGACWNTKVEPNSK